MYIFGNIKRRRYWTKLYQIYSQYSRIITDKLLKIRLAILQSISVCQGEE